MKQDRGERVRRVHQDHEIDRNWLQSVEIHYVFYFPKDAAIIGLKYRYVPDLDPGAGILNEERKNNLKKIKILKSKLRMAEV